MDKKLERFHVYFYGPGKGPIETSFEEAQARLEQEPRLHFEPDGSFVWSLDAKEQVYGMLYDAQGRLQYAELQGLCTLQTWQQLVGLVGGLVGGEREAIKTTVSDYQVMMLPDRILKDLHAFEEKTWMEE
ncbi:hypothetical protein Q31b_30480 [Novipirellula aureliae]|uniref:Uncharacterized protein n=1 Tax=Novipirellula aureliae TaxID=2527966 RepID=A0A5C6E0W8_9BACT|nr:hypothetical protein [Novipirellula aureliae]TWU41597.1 hypothetical protein Q31b_30480 [Novipirellula aureliae]